jgi:hypothetical protein
MSIAFVKTERGVAANLPSFMDGWHVTFADNDADLVAGNLLEY